MESPFTDLMVLTDQDLRALQTPEGVFDNFLRVMILNARKAITEAVEEIDDLEGFCIGIANIEQVAEDYAEMRCLRAFRRAYLLGIRPSEAYSQLPA